MNNKKWKTILNSFIEILSKLTQKWLKNIDISMYSTYNEGKSVVAERFQRRIKFEG